MVGLEGALKLPKEILRISNFEGGLDNSNEHIGHHNFNGKEGTHFKIIMDDKLNISKSRLQTHRKINELLKEEFSQGMHTLEIKIIN